MLKTKLLVIICLLWTGTFLDRFNNELAVPIGTKLPNFVAEYRHHDIKHHSETANDYDEDDNVVGVDDLEPDNYDYSSDDLDYNEEDKEKGHENEKKSKDKNNQKKLAWPDGQHTSNDLDYPYPAPPPKPSHDKRKSHHKKHHHHHHHNDKSKHHSTATIHDKSIPGLELEPNQRFQVINLNFNVGNFGKVEAKGKLYFDIDLFLKAMKKMK